MRVTSYPRTFLEWDSSEKNSYVVGVETAMAGIPLILRRASEKNSYVVGVETPSRSRTRQNLQNEVRMGGER